MSQALEAPRAGAACAHAAPAYAHTRAAPAVCHVCGCWPEDGSGLSARVSGGRVVICCQAHL